MPMTPTFRRVASQVADDTAIKVSQTAPPPESGATATPLVKPRQSGNHFTKRRDRAPDISRSSSPSPRCERHASHIEHRPQLARKTSIRKGTPAVRRTPEGTALLIHKSAGENPPGEWR